MFSNQDIDYSLNRPCRCLSAVAPPSKSSSQSAPATNDDADGWGADDEEDYPESSSAFVASHRFLAGSAIPSVSKLSDDGDDGGSGSILEEDDDERTNRLYLLQYHEDSAELTQERSWVHPTGEAWAMACHPTRGEWVATCGGGAVFAANAVEGEEKKAVDAPLTTFRTALWRIPELGEGGDEEDGAFNFDEADGGGSAQASSSKLELMVKIPHGESSTATTSGWEQRVGQILWNPLLSPSNSTGDALFDLADTASTDGGGNLITVGWDAQSPIALWDISSTSDAKEVWSTGVSGVASSRRRGRNFAKLASMNSALPRRVSWDPHDTHNILATSGVDVVAYDMRAPASTGAGVIRSAHRYGVADVCHNHMQPHVVVTAGMDGVVKFWDLRMHLSEGLEALADGGSVPSLPPPLLKAVRGGHSHWTTRATYNPSYDQLVLSGGSDGIANLWRISSCSSAPLLDLGDEEEDVEEEGSFGDDGMEGEEGEEKVDDGEGDVNEEGGWNEDEQPSPKSDDGDEDKGKSPKNESSASDIRVTRFECSDVTADLAWSASDPWVYATMSYDGAVVVHHVPSKEKYKILL